MLATLSVQWSWGYQTEQSVKTHMRHDTQSIRMNTLTIFRALTILKTASCFAMMANWEVLALVNNIIIRGTALCKEKNNYFQNGWDRYLELLTTTVTTKSKMFHGFFQNPLKLSIHLRTISVMKTTTENESMKFKSIFRIAIPISFVTGSSTVYKKQHQVIINVDYIHVHLVYIPSSTPMEMAFIMMRINSIFWNLLSL